MTDLLQSRVWNKYIHKTRACDITPQAARWCICYAEVYIEVYSEVRLRQHIPASLRSIAERKAEIRVFEPGSFVKSLTALFVGLVEVA